MSTSPADKEFWNFKVVDLGRLVERNRVELMLAFCRSVESWLKSDPLNMALVYCDKSRAASTIALACYFADCFENRVTKAFQELVEMRNSANGTPPIEWGPSHHHLIECVELCIRGEVRLEECVPILLERVILTGLRVTHDGDKDELWKDHYFQILAGDDILFSTRAGLAFGAGAIQASSCASMAWIRTYIHARMHPYINSYTLCMG